MILKNIMYQFTYIKFSTRDCGDNRGSWVPIRLSWMVAKYLCNVFFIHRDFANFELAIYIADDRHFIGLRSPYTVALVDEVRSGTNQASMMYITSTLLVLLDSLHYICVLHLYQIVSNTTSSNIKNYMVSCTPNMHFKQFSHVVEYD
jgi:hypothetical protein